MMNNIWIILILIILVGIFLIRKAKKEETNPEININSMSDLDDVESLSQMTDIMKSGSGDYEKGLQDYEIEEYQKQVNEKFDMQIPEDYVDFLKSMNKYYYGRLTSITYFGKSDKSSSDIISITDKFRFNMEDWETGQLQEAFIVLGKYNDGEGFIFYLKDSKKYLIIDCLADVYLDDLTDLNTVDTFLDVLKYIGKKSDNYK